MPRIHKPRSSRRAPQLEDNDYDHEIALVDHAADLPTPQIITPEPQEENAQTPSNAEAGPSTDPRRSSSSLRVHSLKSRRSDSPSSQKSQKSQKSSKKPSKSRGKSPDKTTPPPPTVQVEQPTPQERPLAQSNATNGKTPHRRPTPETAIDVLYENERGGIFCGIPLFSSKALGNLDPAPWTNYLHKSSPTDTRTAQVPDPSWEWAWPDWHINHDVGVDKNGWEYSFMFSKKFSWHKAHWYNSCVRRRAWIRKRMRRNHDATDLHMLNTEYFTVRTSAELHRIASKASAEHSRLGSKASMSQLSSHASTRMSSDAVEKPDIEDLGTLMAVLRLSRIDREKIEAVDNFLQNGGEELVHLQEQMHEIMAIFVFQASRRILLSKLTDLFNETKKQMEENDSGKLQRRSNNLKAAIRHADEELRRLEYWSDVKNLVAEGKAATATDKGKGWDHSWQGVDNSGPAMPDNSKCDV